MSREEQIVEAGKTAAEGKEFSVLVNKQRRTMSAYEIGFIEGAEWADQHPAWESVKDSLPEDDECCLIYGDCGIDIGSYNSKTQYWLSEYSGQPTHWMPLPTPPVKKGGSDDSKD